MRRIKFRTSRNRVQNNPETTTRSALESLVIGLIENSTAICQNADTHWTSNEPNPEAPKLTPSVVTEGTPSAAEISSGGAEGSRNPAVRVVPFQSLPQSAQEEMGKYLFDDPLLTMENVNKHFDLLLNPCFLYRRIIRHGTACLRLRKMLLLLMIARNGRQLLELCCRGKYPISIVASKNLNFLN